MAQYIDKSAIIAEIKRITKEHHSGYLVCLKDMLSFIDTLEVKEIHEDIDMDLNPLFEEFGIEPDSRIASMFKEVFYKLVDRYLNKKEDEL